MINNENLNDFMRKDISETKIILKIILKIIPKIARYSNHLGG